MRTRPGSPYPLGAAWDGSGVNFALFSENATRIELRSPDPSCNIYLAFACMLMAGLKGLQNKYPLPDPIEENI